MTPEGFRHHHQAIGLRTEFEAENGCRLCRIMWHGLVLTENGEMNEVKKVS